MRVHNLRVHLVLTIFFLTSFAAGETLTGTVKNSTTGKPSAGDEIAAQTRPVERVAIEVAFATVDQPDIRGSKPYNRDPSGAASH